MDVDAVGVCVCFCVCCCIHPCGQELLGLDLGQRYAGKWVSHQWKQWGTMITAQWFLPAASLQSGEQGKQGADSLGLEFYSASTAAVLLLLNRWASELKGPQSREAARKVLGALVGQCPADFEVPLKLDEALDVVRHTPVSLEEATHVIEVRDGCIPVADLCPLLPGLRRKEMRTEGGPSEFAGSGCCFGCGGLDCPVGCFPSPGPCWW